MNILGRILLICAGIFVVFIILASIIYHDRRPQIFHDVEDGNTNAIAQYLASGNNINTPVLSYPFGGNRNVPLLEIAIANGQLETVGFLLKNKADPNLPDYTGETPLEYAVGRVNNDVSKEKQKEILNMLVMAGADPNRPSSDRNLGFGLPLIQASEFGDVEMINVLLAAGAFANATNYEGMTALHFAQNTNVAQLLIRAGADVNAHAGGETPAQTAVRFGNSSVLSVLTNDPAYKP